MTPAAARSTTRSEPEPSPKAAPRAGDARIAPVFQPAGVGTAVRAKLRLGSASDEEEKQADAFAEQVEQGKPVSVPAAADEEPVRRKAAAGGAITLPPSVAGTVHSPGAGAPMDAAPRARIEASTGARLDAVRVHTDAGAQRAAAAIDARAFTHGTHIWLGAGESAADVPLLAHESAHVLAGSSPVVRRKPREDPRLEAPADPHQEPAEETAPDGPEAPERAEATSSSAPEPAAETSPASVAPTGTPTADAGSEAPAASGGEEEEEAPAPEEETAVAAGSAPAPAAAPGEQGGEAAVPASAEEDPRFQAVLAQVEAKAGAEKSHAPAAEKVAQAQGAAEPPANERSSRAQANQVQQIEGAEVAKPEPDSFLALLRSKLEQIAPKNLDEMDKFKESGKAGELKGAVTGEVGQQKAAATADVRTRTEAAPDEAAVPEQPASPLPDPEQAPATPGIQATDAVPPPQPEAAVSLEESRQRTEDELAGNNLTEEQLQKANDPRFTAVLDAKQQVAEHAETAPVQFRETENAELDATRVSALNATGAATGQMQGVRAQNTAVVGGQQLETKSKDEAARLEVATHIEGIYEEVRSAVQAKLDGLDTEVNERFDAGESAARQEMEDHVNRRKEAYKAERYSGITGKGRWAYDLFAGLPDEVQVFYDEARDLYLTKMDAVIVAIAELVETRLKEAKEEVVRGRQRIQEYVTGLPAQLQEAGTAAQRAVADRFDQLEKSVDEKKEQLAESLAQRYQEARDRADEQLKAMREQDRGLVDQFVAAVAGVLQILIDFKNRLLALVGEAKDAIELIISDPIGFLKNLLAAITLGVRQFVDNIWTHLKAGFFAWLFGALASAGINVPSELSLRSILGLVLEVLGLTYPNIRKKAVKLIGERNVELLEKVWEFVSALISGGLGGLWDHVKEYLSDLKETIVSAVQEWVVTKIITAAVTKLVSMFNPVGAIIQAILTIYNVVQFFIERMSQIMELVQAVVSSVSKIARGMIADAANWIEKAMARALPVMISFLAALLGLGGIAAKVKGIIEKVQARVDAAIDKAIGKIIGVVGKLLGKGSRRETDKTRGKDDTQRGETGDPAHDAKWRAAVTAVRTDIDRLEKDGIEEKDLVASVPRWRTAHGFKTLSLESTGDAWLIKGSMSETTPIDTVPRPGTNTKPFDLEWPKPAAASYRPLYLGGPVGTYIKQKDLKSKVGQVIGGKPVKQFNPTDASTLPGGESIGLDPKYCVAVGGVVGPLTEATTPGGKKLNNILKRYGFSPKGEYRDADHVQEIQFGGIDDPINLWPLNASLNRGAGSILSKASVKHPDTGKLLSISEMKKTSGKDKHFFKITKVVAADPE